MIKKQNPVPKMGTTLSLKWGRIGGGLSLKWGHPVPKMGTNWAIFDAFLSLKWGHPYNHTSYKLILMSLSKIFVRKTSKIARMKILRFTAIRQVSNFIGFGPNGPRLFLAPNRCVVTSVLSPKNSGGFFYEIF